jgi:hypothetical protein
VKHHREQRDADRSGQARHETDHSELSDSRGGEAGEHDSGGKDLHCEKDDGETDRESGKQRKAMVRGQRPAERSEAFSGNNAKSDPLRSTVRT